jgi:hypothetical protein
MEAIVVRSQFYANSRFILVVLFLLRSVLLLLPLFRLKFIEIYLKFKFLERSTPAAANPKQPTNNTTTTTTTLIEIMKREQVREREENTESEFIAE